MRRLQERGSQPCKVRELEGGSIKNMKSALFVDFDNVFSQLRQLQPDAAERFAHHPSEWIGWLTRSRALPKPHDEGERRRLLVRRCYLNPNWHQNYRHAFLRAGFEIGASFATATGAPPSWRSASRRPPTNPRPIC